MEVWAVRKIGNERTPPTSVLSSCASLKIRESEVQWTSVYCSGVCIPWISVCSKPVSETPQLRTHVYKEYKCSLSEPWPLLERNQEWHPQRWVEAFMHLVRRLTMSWVWWGPNLPTFCWCLQCMIYQIHLVGPHLPGRRSTEHIRIGTSGPECIPIWVKLASATCLHFILFHNQTFTTSLFIL